MTLAQLFADRATNGAAGTDNDNFHGRLLMGERLFFNKTDIG
jgi:hypothetical protein